jgi:hypothetical protein
MIETNGKLEALEADSPEASDFWARIEKLRKDAAAGTPDFRELQNIIDEIDTKCGQPPLVKLGWLFVAKLASGFLFGDLSRELVSQVDRFIEYVKENPADGSITDFLIENIPNMFYVAGDLRRAAQYVEILSNGPLKDRIDPGSIPGLEFNRLTYLLELEHLQPMRSEKMRTKLKEQARAVLDDPVVNQIEQMASAIMDTQGLYKIVFGKDAPEVRAGIDLCVKAADIAAEWEKDCAEACREWRLEAGWLRYFDLSSRW